MKSSSGSGRWFKSAVAIVAAVGLAACAPGSSSDNTTTSESAPADTGTSESSPADTGTSESSPADTGTSEPTSEPTETGSTEPVTLVVWDQEVRGGQNEQMTRLNEAFQEKYPHITIERNSQSFDDLATTLPLALSDPNPPDVVQANNARNTMGVFVEAGLLLPLDDYAAQLGWTDRFSETVLKYTSYSADATVFGGGNLYGLAQTGEIVGVFYSKSKLAELGIEVPTTWEDYVAALETAKAAGETPMQLGNLEGWPAVHVFGPIQAQYVAPADVTNLGMGNPGSSWKTAENETSATILQDWVKAGYFNEGPNGTDYDPAWQAFADGDGVFLMAGSWLAADLDDAMGEDVGFFAPPARDGGKVSTTGGTGLPFVITTASAHPDEAALYLDFITSDDAMAILAETGNLPVNRTAELSSSITGVNADIFAAFGLVTTEGELLPYLDWATPTMGDTIGQSLQDLIAEQVTPAEFLQKVEDDYAAFTG